MAGLVRPDSDCGDTKYEVSWGPAECVIMTDEEVEEWKQQHKK